MRAGGQGADEVGGGIANDGSVRSAWQ
jgi:hypothetical protein